MNAGRNQQRAQSQAILVARAVLAATLALSFFTVLAPLGSASAGSSGLMACCIGKPGHESGSCSTGLLDSAKRGRVEPHVSLPVEGTPKKKSFKFGDVKGGAGAGEHCSLHTQSPTEKTENPKETFKPEPGPSIAEVVDPFPISPENRDMKAEPTSASREPTGAGSIDALSSPCPMECGTCSVNYTRRPRPRDQSTLSILPKHPLPLGRRFSSGAFEPIRVLLAKFLQLHPRAPPALLL
jgi:hypothetical protein